MQIVPELWETQRWIIDGEGAPACLEQVLASKPGQETQGSKSGMNNPLVKLQTKIPLASGRLNNRDKWVTPSAALPPTPSPRCKFNKPKSKPSKAWSFLRFKTLKCEAPHYMCLFSIKKGEITGVTSMSYQWYLFDFYFESALLAFSGAGIKLFWIVQYKERYQFSPKNFQKETSLCLTLQK